ncbi:low molecular weight protein-tyrosine-phosphatase [Lysinibacillus sp. 54212]|uniref:low molecular weight protein-tyrosine-phosphatase n=1 Tax=Lysinibacillus sp. 54212 TaxID=3119829 RepID=UPI002FC96BB1
MIRVLFVCLGNICRSPMAEAVMRDLVEKRGLSAEIKIDSAGTSSWHIDEPPHKGTRAKLEEYKISTSGMKARQLRTSDVDFDYIVCMDASNVENTRNMLREDDNTKIIRFLDLTFHKKDVPDPWYTGDFQETYELCLDGCNALLERIMEARK